MKIDQYKNLKKHLQTQIKAADRIGSKWVYILKEDAEKCFELADVQETLISNPVNAEVEGGGSSWWCVCGECHGIIDFKDSYCKHCGRKIKL